MDSMNYIGSVSILDRGDSPAQAILDKNARSMAQRVADETKEELNKVMTRVENIYGNYELSATMMEDSKSSIEYIQDIGELEELLQDTIKKRKYQQQVTVFVVGFQNVSGQRLKLLQQVNEFFMENQNLDEQEYRVITPEVDLDTVQDIITDTLDTANGLTQRIAELNTEMLDWLANYAHSKATNKGRKKLEKALNQAKEDITALTEKLMAAQTDVEEKEDKMSQLFKQIEIKNMEVQKFKSAAEVAKKNSTGADAMREELQKKEHTIEELLKKIKDLELELKSQEYSREKSENRQKESEPRPLTETELTEQQLRENQAAIDTVKKDLEALHEKQITDLVMVHRNDMDELKQQHEAEIKRIQAELDAAYRTKSQTDSTIQEQQEQIQKLQELQQQQNKTAEKGHEYESAQDSDFDAERMSDNTSKMSRQSSKAEISKILSKDATKSSKSSTSKRSSKSRASTKQEKRDDDIDLDSVASEPPPPLTRQSNHRSRSTLETVQELDAAELEGAPDVLDEEAWSNIPGPQLPSKFNTYRQLTKKKIGEIEDILNVTTIKTQKKVQTLKAQFQEHKSKWEQERDVLIKQVDQAQLLQAEAEREADATMSQLEEFITEQEMMEKEEEEKESQLPQKTVVTPPPAATPPAVVTEDMKDLMQQTDDAKIRQSAAARRETPVAAIQTPVAAAHTPAAAAATPSSIPPAILQKVTQETEDEFQRKMSAKSRRSSGSNSPFETPQVQELKFTSISKAASTEEIRPSAPSPSRPTTVPRTSTPSGRRSALKSRESSRSKKALSVKFLDDDNKDDDTGSEILDTVMATMAELPPVFEDALESVKDMMVEDNLDEVQTKQLHAIRDAVLYQEIASHDLSEDQKNRTLAIYSLASQMSTETILLGFEPASIFKVFAHLASIPMADMANLKIPDVRTGTDSKSTLASSVSVTQDDYQNDVVEEENAAAARSPDIAVDATVGSPEREKTPASGVKSKTPSVKGKTPTQSPTQGSDVPQQTQELSETEADIQEADVQEEPTVESIDSVSRAPTEAEGRSSEAKSRASIRSQYRQKLEERRAAMEARRASVTSQSLLGGHEDTGDVPFPEDKGGVSGIDVGTSPMTIRDSSSVVLRRKGIHLADHPIVKEYFHVYDGVMKFKRDLSNLLTDKELLQAGEILSEIEPYQFDKNEKVQPQIEEMTTNIRNVFEETMQVLSSVIVYDRAPQISSINFESREPTVMTRERSFDSGRGFTRESYRSVGTKMTPQPPQKTPSASSQNKQTRELEAQYNELQKIFEETNKKHQEEINQKDSAVLEMQETINELQQELSALQKQGSPTRYSSHAGTPYTNADSVMFTRLDAERNAKALKKAVIDKKIDTGIYKDVVEKMEEYVSIPAQRLAHLVRKYMHHCRMKMVEESIRISKSLDEDVFQVLDKMELLQNVRAQRWADRMDMMGAARIHLANILMESLDAIEQESGIFLIKPMYSFRGRGQFDRYNGPLSKPYRPVQEYSPRDRSGYAPAPTPASNIRSAIYRRSVQPPPMLADIPDNTPIEEGDGIQGGPVSWMGETPRPTWNVNASQSRLPSDLNMGMLSSSLNTPRMLELDINRMLIGQNQISTKIKTGGLSDDRLVNAANTNLRSYVTVNRPSANPSPQKEKRPRSHTGMVEGTTAAPPGTPLAAPGSADKRVRPTEGVDIPSTLPSTPPLPPITPRDSPKKEQTQDSLFEPAPPMSPPGSSVMNGGRKPDDDEPQPQHVTRIVTRTPSAQSNKSFTAEVDEDGER